MIPPFRIAIGAVVLLFFCVPAAPQERQPAFEVASIKRDLSGRPGPMFRMLPEFTAERATLEDLVTAAYGVHDFQVMGGPGWITSDRYNIQAKSEGRAAFDQEYRRLQLRRMQTLLSDRFLLKVHRETKQLPVYELTMAKGGPKLQPPNCIEREPGDLTIAPGKTMMDYCGSGGFSARGHYQASNANTAELAGALSFVLGRSVIDKTGIAGRFRMLLTFTPDVGSTLLPDAGVPAGTDSAADLFTAIQEQLGLKLESGKGPVEVIVIDRAEKPSEN